MTQHPVFWYDPAPDEPLLEEGVTLGWLVVWTGEPGPAQIKPVAALVDDDGNVVIEDLGDWDDTHVVSDGA